MTTTAVTSEQSRNGPAMSPGKVLLIGFVLIFYTLVAWVVYTTNTPADAETLAGMGKCERTRIERLLSEGITVSKSDVNSAKWSCKDEAEELALLRQQTQALGSAASAAAPAPH